MAWNARQSIPLTTRPVCTRPGAISALARSGRSSGARALLLAVDAGTERDCARNVCQHGPFAKIACAKIKSDGNAARSG